MIDKDQRFLEEEKPLIDFPFFVIAGLVIISLFFALCLLFLPGYVTLLIFVSLASLIGIFLNPYIGVLVFIAGAYLHPGEWIPQLAQFHPARLLAIGVLFIWAFHVLVYRDFKLNKSPQMFFLLGYATMLFLSCFKYFDYSFPLFFEQAIKFLILYFIITHLVKDKNQYIGIVWAIIILAAIASTFGLYQHIFNIGRHYFEGRVRITGTETDPNFFGIQQVLAVPLILSLFYTYKNKAVKIFLLSIFFLVLYTIVFTYSRTAMLALGAVLFLSFLRPIFFKRRNFTPLIIMILIFLVLIPFVPTEYWQRAKSITNLEDAAIRSRIGAWRLGLNMVRQNPFRGVGFGVFQYEYLKEAIIAPDVSGIYQTAMFAHNSFIELAAEAGLIAFVFFSLIIFSAFKYLKKAQKAFYEKGDFLMLHTTMGLEVSLVAFLIGAFFLSNLWVLSIWIIIPLSVVLKKLTGKEKAQ